MFITGKVIALRSSQAIEVPVEAVRILIVDDEQIFLMCVHSQLSRKGFIVHTADNTDEAVNIAMKEKIDIVIMDGQLPGKYSSLEAIQLLKEMHAPVSIIGVSGMPKTYFESSAIDHVVTKPVNIEHLVEIMQEALKSTSGRSLTSPQ